MDFTTAGNTARMTIDSNGRLVVGSGTDTAESTIVAKGNSTSSTSFSVIDLRRGEVADAVNDVLGYIRFTDTNVDSNNRNYAHIHAAVDAASGSGTDNPGRLVFSTTADGGSGPTERLRIDSSGIAWLNFANPVASSLMILDKSGGGESQIRFYNAGSNTAQIALDASEHLTFDVNGGERLRIQEDGSVHIDGPTAAAHGLRFTPNGWNGYDNRMGFCGSSGADFWWSSNWNPTNGNRDHSGYATNFIRQNVDTGYLAFGTGPVNTSASERFRIASDGDITHTGSDNVEYKMKCGTSSGNNILAFLNSGGTTRGNITYDSDNDFLFFNVNQDERFRITNAGRTELRKDSECLRLMPTTSGNAVYMEFYDDGNSSRQGFFGYGSSTEGNATMHIHQTRNAVIEFRTNNTYAAELTPSNQFGINGTCGGWAESLQVHTQDANGWGLTVRHKHDSAGTMVRFYTCLLYTSPSPRDS